LAVVFLCIVSENECFYPLLEFVEFFGHDELFFVEVGRLREFTSFRLSFMDADTVVIGELGFLGLIY
jgi:hypothetical protein